MPSRQQPLARGHRDQGYEPFGLGCTAECRGESLAERLAAHDQRERVAHALRPGVGVEPFGIGRALFGERQGGELRRVTENRFGAPVRRHRRPQEVSCGGDRDGCDAPSRFAGCGGCHRYAGL